MKPIVGQIGDYTIEINLVPNLGNSEGELLDGRARALTKEMHGEMQLDANLKGRALINTFIHEALHMAEYIYGWKAKHQDVYVLASMLTQLLTSTGIIKEAEFEARVRRLAGATKK